MEEIRDEENGQWRRGGDAPPRIGCNGGVAPAPDFRVRILEARTKRAFRLSTRAPVGAAAGSQRHLERAAFRAIAGETPLGRKRRMVGVSPRDMRSPLHCW